jgi:hypothetical protein
MEALTEIELKHIASLGEEFFWEASDPLQADEAALFASRDVFANEVGD